MSLLRYMDLVLLWLSVPLALALGAPAVGVLAGAVAWTVQRIAAQAVDRRARGLSTPREAIGLNMATMFARMWLLVSTILAAGLAGSREDGVAAAVLLLSVFTVSFATAMLSRSLDSTTTHP